MAYSKRTYRSTPQPYFASKASEIDSKGVIANKILKSDGNGGSIWGDGTIKGEGKNWYEVNLTQEDILSLVQGNQLVKNFTTPYNPEDFKNDYFLCKIDQTATVDGQLILPAESMEKLYVNVEGLNDIIPYMIKSIDYTLSEVGFDYHYYKTLVLYAGCDQPVGDAPYILSDEGALEENNVIYLQDVTQQDWEYNVSEGKVVIPSRRETLEYQITGGAFVVSIKGKNAANSASFLYCIQSSQAAYWDSTDNTTKWANIEAGKFYQVTFDPASGTGAHGTERWLVNPTTVEGEVWATELTDEVIESLLETGIEFEASKYCAEYLTDDSMKLFTPCIGPTDKTLSRVFSFNSGFEEPETHHIEYIGRPLAYLIDTYTWYDYEEDPVTHELVRIKHIEKDGEYIWQSDVQGVPIQLTIPDNNDEEGVPQRNIYVLEMNLSNLTTNVDIFRHTFTITPQSEATFEANEYKAYLSFCAVNSQEGDNSIDYLLHSDETGQAADWILPVSGIIGKVEAGGTVSKWYTAGRIIAGWTLDEEPKRCLYIDYINEESGELVKAPLITDENAHKYYSRDFRSSIGTFKSPSNVKIKY